MATAPAPVLELVTLRITVSQEEALAKQAAPINNTLRKAPGFQHITWGFQAEDPTVLHWLIRWESLAHHEALIASPAYGPFVTLLTTFATPALIHSTVTVPPAAVVEWITVTLTADADHGSHVARAGALKDALHGVPGFKGIDSATVIENERAIVSLVGWDSVQAHDDWRSSQTPELTEKLLAVYQGKDVAAVSMWHVVVKGEAGPA